MKIDYDLVREIMLKLEELIDGRSVAWKNLYTINVKNPDTLLIHENIKYLNNLRLIDIEGATVTHITPKDVDFTNCVRNIETWNEIKKRYTLDELSFDTIIRVSEEIYHDKG